MINKEEYENACSEVLEILNHLSLILLKKIPKTKIDFFRKNMNPEYKFKYDINKGINEQNISLISKFMLYDLFKTYMATEEDKKTIEKLENEKLIKLEEEKLGKYNPDLLFKNKNLKENMPIVENTQLIDINQLSWYQKIFIKIKNKFRKL